MHKLILFIKSYRPDFNNTENLLKSIQKYNCDNIPVYLSVNDIDYDYFKENLKYPTAKILRDSEIFEYPPDDGWRYQQIIKSNLYRLNICENYLCIDSDSEFIRNFYYSDFMYNESTPYTIMHESKGFLETMENIGIDSENIFFKEALRITRPFFGNTGKEWDYGPSPYLWNCNVWRHFNEVFLKNQNISFIDFFNKIDKKTPPSECVIYGEYLLKTKLIDILPIEGLFKVYHYQKQFKLEKKFHNLEKLKKNYIGIIFQSNWSNRRKKWYKFL
ncbi:DUF6492 family protein [Epilithonimonas ginsengisoli]|uniref:DUF6492 family protein n=1 Tax=Epilithonimonas ginsengisoli TaxID=1245592 RepID=A0ABU4JCD5_9FLAO|nr:MULTISPECIES: DUF6492 family protein [Chryseobacterium group]MBV6878435.1 hypothetical protein [Epilithonimonas sp. FP105]MDW8547322.1 DUF6492 family protein [Epilithonimonas ginsengisoli]OAH69079.1 hypothetical protein AXA65_16760 [Chryseobacterium sp. FP211-J200]